MSLKAESDERKAVKEAQQLIHISPKEAPKLLDALARRYREEGQIGCALQARRYQCFALMGNLDFVHARECLEQLFEEANEAGERRFVGIGEMYLGIVATENGEIDTAAECFDHAIHIGAEIQDPDLIHRVQVNLGYAQLMMDRYDEALESLRLCARTFESGGSATEGAALYVNIACATTHIAYRAAIEGKLTPELLDEAKRSLEAAEMHSRDNFRYESLTAFLYALYIGVKDGSRAGLSQLEKTRNSVFQRAQLSLSMFHSIIECKLYELGKDWPNVRKVSAMLIRMMKRHRSLSQFQSVYSLAARAHAEDGNYQMAYWLLQECSKYLQSVRNATGLHGAHITNLRYGLEQKEMDQAILKMRNRSLMERNEALEREARLDPLSGVLNRRGIEEAMMEYAEQRTVRKFAIGLLDIDFFKQVNDRFGHAVGDRVITEFAQCIGRSATCPAKIGRWGGEEFLILFDIEQPEEMEALGEKIIEEIRKHAWQAIHPGLKITASFGLAMWRVGDSLDEVTERADKMLYSVKQSGRNNWRVASYNHAA